MKLSNRFRLPATVIALAGWLVLLITVVPPWGNFPIADDGAYASSVRWLLQGGRLRISEFAGPASITNILWGALFCLPGGFSHTALRLSTLAAAIMALVALFFLLKELGLPEEKRLLGCSLLAFNPWFLVVSYTFQTDILFLALFLFSCAAILRGLKQRSTAWLWGGSAAVAVALLSRQIGLAPSLAGAYFLYRSKAPGRRYLSLLLLPLTVLALHAVWFHYFHGITHAYWYHRHESLQRLRHPLRLAYESAVRLGASVQYLGWMLFPISLGILGNPLKRPAISRQKIPWIALMAGLLILAWTVQGPLPALGDQLSQKGLGVIPVPGAAFKVAGWWQNPFLWDAVNVLSLFSVLVLATGNRPKDDGLDFLGAASLLAFAPALLSFSFFDRYFLVLLPWGAAAALRGGLKRPSLSWLAIAAFGIFSLIGLKDFMSWNAALWRAGSLAVERGYAPGEVMGGMSWDGEHIADKNIEILKSEKPIESIRPFEWRDMNRFRALISFNPAAPPSTHRLLTMPYESPLSTNGAAIYVYAKDP